MVLRVSHPLCGERLAALSFQRKAGELRLVVVFPDGTPGMIAAADTDIFGVPQSPVVAPTALSVEGVRRFRMLVDARLVRVTVRRRPRPWRVVRHKTGVDPFHHILELFSSHTTEQAAVRARDRVRAAAIKTAGYEVSARWEWAVVNDPAGLLIGPAGTGEERRR
jgi:hypothetical protein